MKPASNEVSKETWLNYLRNWEKEIPKTVNSFKAGRLKDFAHNWEAITSDAWILKMIRGIDIEFDEPVRQSRPPRPILFSPQETEIIDAEVTKLSEKGVIVEAEHSEDEYISNIFVCPKKDGGHRVILNLKHLNLSVTKRHFKMQSLQSAINLMTAGCYMASIDWKDAYYTVPVDTRYRKYLRFVWKNRLWQYTCLPNGLSSGPRLFTKITKPIYSHLRKAGHLNAGYIDDSFLTGDTVDDCRSNVIDTVELSMDSGFVVHPVKSVFNQHKLCPTLGSY